MRRCVALASSVDGSIVTLSTVSQSNAPAARRHVRVDGVATECGIACGDPKRFPGLLAAHVQTAELGAQV